jgi:hypothetical protein
MPAGLRILRKLTGLWIFLGSVTLNAQLLQDTATMNLVGKGIDYIDNLQFKEAHEVYARITSLYPQHPIAFLMRGLLTYWENYPMLHSSPFHVSFEEDMRQCIRLSETGKKPGNEPEYLLADLCARGMLLSFYDDNDLTMEVIPLARGTYKYIRRAFDFTSACVDLSYFTGVYDYYREAYPKIYPVYKSLAFLFPRGDMEKGLKELQRAAENSVVLRAESNSMLEWIYLSFENNYSVSLIYCKILNAKYPENEQFLSTYIRNLLLMKNYDEAEKLIPSSAGNKFFQAQFTILKGILKEKKYHDNTLAQQYYKDGINEISLFGKYGNEYAAYAYFGLSRISEELGEKHTHKSYRKTALKLADFKSIDFDD